MKLRAFSLQSSWDSFSFDSKIVETSSIDLAMANQVNLCLDH